MHAAVVCDMYGTDCRAGNQPSRATRTSPLWLSALPSFAWTSISTSMSLGNGGPEAGSSLACRLLAGSKPSRISCRCLEELILRAGGGYQWDRAPLDLNQMGAEPRSWSLCIMYFPPQLLLKPLNLRSYMVGELCEKAIYISNEMRIWDVFLLPFLKNSSLEMDKWWHCKLYE